MLHPVLMYLSFKYSLSLSLSLSSLVHDGNRNLPGAGGGRRLAGRRRGRLCLLGLPVDDVGLDPGAHVVRQRVHPLGQVAARPVLQQGQRQVEVLWEGKAGLYVGSRPSDSAWPNRVGAGNATGYSYTMLVKIQHIFRSCQLPDSDFTEPLGRT